MFGWMDGRGEGDNHEAIRQVDWQVERIASKKKSRIGLHHEKKYDLHEGKHELYYVNALYIIWSTHSRIH